MANAAHNLMRTQDGVTLGPLIDLHIRHMPGGVFTDHVFGAMKLREGLTVEARNAAGQGRLPELVGMRVTGLTQGELDGDLVTCAWHNWKFRVTDGACVQGEEGVQTHHVEIADDGAVRVSINRRT